MNVIRYSPWKLLVLALVTAVPAGFFLWMLITPDVFMAVHGRSSFWFHLVADNFWLCGGLFLLCGGVTALALGIAFGDRTALAFGAGGVELRTIYRQYRLSWADIVGIVVLDASRSARRAESLIVRIRRDNGGEKSLYVATNLLEQSRGEIERILETAAHTAPSRARAPAGAAMDYDGAIARHLAGRQAGSAAPARGGFGRKGL